MTETNEDADEDKDEDEDDDEVEVYVTASETSITSPEITPPASPKRPLTSVPSPRRKRLRPSPVKSSQPATNKATTMEQVLLVEHNLKIKHMKVQHELQMEILNVQLQIAKLKLEKSQTSIDMVF